MELVIYFLSALGVVNIFVYSPIIGWIRNIIIKIFKVFNKEDRGKMLVSCPTCAGVWIGLMLLPIFLTGNIMWMLPFAVSFLATISTIYWFPIKED